MKAVKLEVDWREDYPNSEPEWKITIDEFHKFENKRWHRFGKVYWSEMDGYVSMIAKENPNIPDMGFGGRETTLTMVDGSTVSFRGGWHTSPSAVWSYPEFGKSLKPFTDCGWYREGDKIKVGIAAFVTLDLLHSLLPKFLPDVEIYQSNFAFVPKKIGQPPKIRRVITDTTDKYLISSEQLSALYSIRY